jgi:hypothetical protein
MASENVERLQLAFEAFARGDIDAVAENIDPDSLSDVGRGSRRRGHTGLTRR